MIDANGSVGRHTEELEPSRPASGDANVKWFGHFSKSYTIPLITGLTHSTPRNPPKRNERICPKSRTEMFTVASFVTARVEMTSVSIINLLMDKYNAVLYTMEYHSAVKRYKVLIL